MADKTIQWLLECDEPWTRYRTRVDLLGQPETDSEVRAARVEMLAHPQVKQLMAEAAAWPGPSRRRHNDASHPLHKLSTLADFGLQARDRGMTSIIKTVLAHQSSQGAFQTMLNMPAAFGLPTRNTPRHGWPSWLSESAREWSHDRCPFDTRAGCAAK